MTQKSRRMLVENGSADPLEVFHDVVNDLPPSFVFLGDRFVVSGLQRVEQLSYDFFERFHHCSLRYRYFFDSFFSADSLNES